MGPFGRCLKLGGKREPSRPLSSTATLLAFIQNNARATYWLSVAAQLPIKPRALRSFKKIAAKINMVVILSSAG